METLGTLGKYEIRRTLGCGAMGIVYEGWDPSIQRRVAIKTVPLSDAADEDIQEGIARFRREAQAAGRLSHPNIVSIYDYGETRSVAYIVMEYIEGPTLKSVMDARERFAMPQILGIMHDLLAGLAFSHERGVVHRDIKPANLMLTSEDLAKSRIKIADFGIARIESSGMTRVGAVMGTPAYMSPEQFMSETVDARTDIYSSGVLLYQLLTGERPFDGGVSAIMHRVLTTEPPPPSRISVTAPRALDAVVLKAMAKRPDDRFASAAAFAAALTAAASAPAADSQTQDATVVTASQPAVPPPEPVPVLTAAVEKPKSSLMPLVVAGVLVLLAAGGGSAWFVLHPSNDVLHPATAPGVAAPEPAKSKPDAAAVPVAPPSPPPEPAKPEPDASAIPVAPLPPQPRPDKPALTPVMIGDVLARITAARHCALIGGTVRDNGDAVLTGFAGPGAEQDIRQEAAGLTGPGAILWRVVAADLVFCPALAVLRSAAPPFGATEPRLDLTLAGDRMALHDGDKIRPRVTMPNFAGYLRVDYIVHDGNLQHLYPQVADAGGIVADKVRLFTAGERISLGDPLPGQPAWEAGPPYGTDMIIAIASSQPLPVPTRPGNVEPMAGYLRDLDAAVQAVRSGGGMVAGNALLVEALAK